MSREPLLSARGLEVRFGAVRAVDGVDLDLFPGETLAVVGESGCGKSTLARALIGLQPVSSGAIRFGEQVVSGRSRAELRPIRRQMQLIFQDPYASLNPRLTVSAIIEEPVLLHRRATKRDADARVCALLEQVGLDPALRRRYPHEFSGGQRQRISIARALAVEPQVLLCDEVTSALDVSVQAQILELLKSLQQKLGLSYLFITHDLGVVRYIADRVLVMYVGQVVELCDAEPLFESPAHPYTQGLLGSVPELRAAQKRDRPLGGEVPSPARPPSGCRFHPRCPKVFERCPRELPELYATPNGQSRCFLSDPSAAPAKAPAAAPE